MSGDILENWLTSDNQALLDDCAIAAMQGILAAERDRSGSDYSAGAIAKRAYDVAAAMMGERGRRNEYGLVPMPLSAVARSLHNWARQTADPIEARSLHALGREIEGAAEGGSL